MTQVLLEPLAGEPGHFFQSAGFLEQVRCSGNGFQPLFTIQLGQGFTIQVQDDAVLCSNEKQNRRFHQSECLLSEIGAASSGDDGVDAGHGQRCRHERGGGSGACAEIAQPDIFDSRLLDEPCGRTTESGGQQVDVEAQVSCCPVENLFIFREQIEQESADASTVKHSSNVLVARTVTAASAAVREEYEPAQVFRDDQVSVENGAFSRAAGRDLHCGLHGGLFF